MIINGIIVFLLYLALVIFATGTAGILRFPDFYSRLHAAGKCDTMAAILALSSIALYHLSENPDLGGVLVALKILLILVFVFISSPTATHAISQAALIIGVEPWGREKK